MSLFCSDVLKATNLISLLKLAHSFIFFSDQSQPPGKEGSWLCFGQNAQRQGRATGTKVSDLTHGTAVARWTYDTGWTVWGSPAISPDGATVYIGSQDSNLYAIKTLDGSVRWRYDTGGGSRSSPAISADGATVYVGSIDIVGSSSKTMHAIKTTDGSARWTYITGGGVYSSPAISADGATVYVGSDEGKLHAIKIITKNDF